MHELTEAAPAHPLDALPLFRRWPPSPLRNVLLTGVWNALVALALVAINLAYSAPGTSAARFWWPNFVIANLVGYLIHGSFNLLGRIGGGRLGRLRGLARAVYLGAVIGGCILVGTSVGGALLRGRLSWAALTQGGAVQLLPFVLLMTLVVALVLSIGERRLRTEALVARQEAQIAEAGRLLAEARLRALQAQIEPHFLYNTLANIVGLIGPQPEQARHMLERFIDFLRASLAASRAEQATLGSELDLIAAYLDVQAVRMGARLRYRIEVDAALRALPLAPMLLQPIVENAVTHGLEPKVEGGEIALAARVADGMLRLDISDTGVGMQGDGRSAKPGGGVGMSNLRERLRSLYGARAAVQWFDHPPGGLTTRLLLPLHGTTD